MNLKNGVRPSMPGEKVTYICHKCNSRFTAKQPLLPLPVKCPERGSLKTERDFATVN